MFVVIFGRPGCPYCVRAKNLAAVPQIFIDEKPIGGCTDFEALMKEQFNVVA
ncbi:MAG: glutaredoxin domain-containing protein [Haemophilus parainfluenzae]|nr:glutaredoxin domain-containing protein [Haemophilus parainfluenzae]